MAEKTKLIGKDMIYWVALVGLLMTFLLWQANHLEGFGWDYDEGVYMISARLMVVGYRLYADIFSPLPPLLVSSIAWAFALWGALARVARLVTVLYSTVGLLAVALIARELGGRLAGLSAIVLLAIAPDFFLYSRVCNGDIPSTGVAVLAIALALHYLRLGQRKWLILSSLAFSTGLLLKFLPAFVGPLLVLTVALRHFELTFPLQWPVKPKDGWQTVIGDFICLAAFIIVPFFCCAVLSDFQSMYEQAVRFPWQAREFFSQDQLLNWRNIAVYLMAANGGLSGLAIYGLWVLLIRKPTRAGLMLTWLILTGLMLAGHAPLWPHLLSPWLFPLAILAGVALGDLFHRLRSVCRGFNWPEARPLLVGLCALILYLAGLPQTVLLDSQMLSAPQLRDDLEVVHFLQTVTELGDFVITDEQLVAFWAERNVPPSLTDTSFTRIIAGHLTFEQMVTVTEEYAPQAIVIQSGGRFALGLPDYVDWVRENYRLARQYDSGIQIYLPLTLPIQSDG